MAAHNASAREYRQRGAFRWEKNVAFVLSIGVSNSLSSLCLHATFYTAHCSFDNGITLEYGPSSWDWLKPIQRLLHQDFNAVFGWPYWESVGPERYSSTGSKKTWLAMKLESIGMKTCSYGLNKKGRIIMDKREPSCGNCLRNPWQY